MVSDKEVLSQLHMAQPLATGCSHAKAHLVSATTQEATWVVLSKSVRRASGNLASSCIALEQISWVKGRFFSECAMRTYIYVQWAAATVAALCVGGQKPCSQVWGNDLETAGRSRLWAFNGLLSFPLLNDK